MKADANNTEGAIKQHIADHLKHPPGGRGGRNNYIHFFDNGAHRVNRVSSVIFIVEILIVLVMEINVNSLWK